MKIIVFLLLITTFLQQSFAQNKYTKATANYFNTIRNQEVLLTAFFQQMPKGGDLHHHYSGSVYTETYIDYVISKNYWIHQQTLEVQAEKTTEDIAWVQFSTLKKENKLAPIKQKLLEKWSVKDYHTTNHDLPQDKHFFTAFSFFRTANVFFNENTTPIYKERLLELKNRAKSESVAYLETMFTPISCSQLSKELGIYNDSLRLYSNNVTQLIRILDKLYAIMLEKGAKECATQHTKLLEKLHQEANIDDTQFTMRYQNYAVRIIEPVDVFGQLLTGMLSAEMSSLIVGVNFVAPEDNETSMNDYALHMQLFKYYKTKFPTVKTSLHAGELALGLVKPEELTWHIHDAVMVAQANRIGHGADIAHEKNSYGIVKKMKQDNIAIEINLGSNEFVLGLKDNKHPFLFYRERGVPIVISTDDAGVLRSNLTEQFVLLARRYPQVSYAEIKEYVYNSILYSFIEEPTVKQTLIQQLDRDFAVFEQKFMKK
jgi:adenosine deaminase/adenosine deaminase CECR1